MYHTNKPKRITSMNDYFFINQIKHTHTHIRVDSNPQPLSRKESVLPTVLRFVVCMHAS